jgi:riboflavin biosynthesis pyrimidine reductase
LKESILNIANADDCSRIIREIFGADLAGDRGVIHVTSVWSESVRSLKTLLIGQDTPGSPTDSFVLSVARARADAIITTGKILRDEPLVTHELEESVSEALFDWRRRRVGKNRPPVSVVLTSGRKIDFEHPLFKSSMRSLVLTTDEAADRLAERAGDFIEVVGRSSPGIRDGVSYLRENRGLESVVIEAGPSTSRQLYEPPVAVDELMLSVYRQPRLVSTARGPLFFSPQELALFFPKARSNHSLKEESGQWSFHRYRR